MNNKKLLVVDIDGTLLTPDPRRQELYEQAQKTKNWDDFYNCKFWGDQPIWGVITIVQDLIKQGYDVVFLTARSEKARPQTIPIHDLIYSPDNKDYELLMRDKNDWRPSDKFKVSKLRNYLAKQSMKGIDYNDIICIDDDEANIQAFKKAGYLTMKV